VSHDDSSEERRPARAEPTFWSTVQAAIADGWGATLRLSVSDVVLKPVNGHEGEPVFMDTLGRVRWRNDDGSAWTFGWLLLEDHIKFSTTALDEQAGAHYRDEYLWLARDEVFGDSLRARTVISSSWGERARTGKPGLR